MYRQSKVEIYVPVNTAEQEKVMNETVKMLCTRFGGATVIPAYGSWIMDDGELVTDKVAIVYSYVPKLSAPVIKAIEKEGLRVKEALKEEAVTIVIDGKVEFV